MSKIDLTKDIQPLSEFRANASTIIEQVKNENRTILITQHGKAAAVLMSVNDYEELIDSVELLKDVIQAQSQISSGNVIEHSEAMRKLRDKYKPK
jgi:prevent-host-death family protein